MKGLTSLGVLVAVAVWIGCQSNDPVGTDMIVMPATAGATSDTQLERPVLAFKDTLMTFGTVSEGHVVHNTFTFVNEGPGQALIADVSTSCGCTVPKTWPREPLAPGATGRIEVAFDTHDKTGDQDKVVSVVANTSPGVIRLHLVGQVVSPDGF